MRPAIERQLINGIVIAIICVFAIVMLTIWQYGRMQDTGAIIKHTNQVLAQTGEVSAMAMQYEINVKNFLLTGDSAYLAVAGDSMRLLPARIRELKVLTADNPHQQARLDSLSVFVAGDRGVIVRVARDGVGTQAQTRAGYSYQIQDILARVAAEERALLEQRRRVNQLKASELQLALWSLIVAVAVLALVVFRMIRLDLGREQLARVASENKYKTLFYKSPLPKWIYDEESLVFLEVNDAAVRLYGYSQQEFHRMTLADIRPPDEVPALMDDISDMRQNPSAYQSSQWRHIRKNGEIIDVQVTAHSIEFEGRRARMVAIIDITERRQYEMQLERLNADLGRRAAELSASNAELERFAYIASHDLQEPLRMVSSFLQLLQKKYGGQLDAKADQYIHYAVDGAERMKALIMDLLEYSRVGSGKEGFGWVDTAGVMAEVGAVFREKIVAARARVEIGELPMVWGDKVQLTQLFQNLLSNALKYQREEPPVIRIGAKVVEEGHCQFFVADNGIGIDPLFFDKIFIIFQRLHNKSDYSGTGIGLAICKKIVERHGGKIWVDSDPQQGSVFYFIINNIKS